eukprot:739736-Pleurochrysis_carterae.AAC.1
MRNPAVISFARNAFDIHINKDSRYCYLTTTCIHAQTRNLIRKVTLWTESGVQTCDLLHQHYLRELARYGATGAQKANGGIDAHEAPKRPRRYQEARS